MIMITLHLIPCANCAFHQRTRGVLCLEHTPMVCRKLRALFTGGVR